VHVLYLESSQIKNNSEHGLKVKIILWKGKGKRNLRVTPSNSKVSSSAYTSICIEKF
jgi:hypothetical protein